MFSGHLFNTDKLGYIKSKKDICGCILCAVRDSVPDVKSLEIARTVLSIACVNLYPYSSGHIMVFPKRHVEDYCMLSEEEALDIFRLSSKLITVIREEFTPSGFNIGYNTGEHSGASIAHIHKHIVPRYPNELGFMDIVGGTRIIVVDPVAVMEKLRAKLAPVQ